MSWEHSFLESCQSPGNGWRPHPSLRPHSAFRPAQVKNDYHYWQLIKDPMYIIEKWTQIMNTCIRTWLLYLFSIKVVYTPSQDPIATHDLPPAYDTIMLSEFVPGTVLESSPPAMLPPKYCDVASLPNYGEPV